MVGENDARFSLLPQTMQNAKFMGSLCFCPVLRTFLLLKSETSLSWEKIGKNHTIAFFKGSLLLPFLKQLFAFV